MQVRGESDRSFYGFWGVKIGAIFRHPPRIPLAFRYKAWYNRHIGLRGAAIAP